MAAEPASSELGPIDAFLGLKAEPARGGGLPELVGYELSGRLGEGGAGVVFKAMDRTLGRWVAVKVPDRGLRFDAEAKAAARLVHPNIVTLFGVGRIDGRPCLVMEFVEGGTLADRLARAPMAFGEAVELLRGLARAVHFAHRHGVVHRDLKPANILLTSDGTPKIADFGLARRLDGSGGATPGTWMAGTPAYMSPEAARGRSADVGPAADLYALRVILYEMLTGRVPFSGEPWTVVRRHIEDQPPAPRTLNPQIPAELERICLRCLRKNPAERHADAGELAADLERFRFAGPAAAPPDQPNRRALLAASAGLFAAGLGIGVLLPRRPTRAPAPAPAPAPVTLYPGPRVPPSVATDVVVRIWVEHLTLVDVRPRRVEYEWLGYILTAIDARGFPIRVVRQEPKWKRFVLEKDAVQNLDMLSFSWESDAAAYHLALMCGGDARVGTMVVTVGSDGRAMLYPRADSGAMPTESAIPNHYIFSERPSEPRLGFRAIMMAFTESALPKPAAG